MVASAIFITDLTGKPLISRNYRGDIPLTSAIDRFASYLNEVEDEMKKPVFHVDSGGEVLNVEDVGCTGVGGETFVYVQVSGHYSEWEGERVGIVLYFKLREVGCHRCSTADIVWFCGGILARIKSIGNYHCLGVN